jgi:two-component system OmpR family sensor kinase
MNRIFFRFFLLIMISITFSTFVVYGSISWLFGDPLEKNAAHQAAPEIFLLEQYIDKAATDEWLLRLNKVREVSHVRLDLIPLSLALTRLPKDRHAALISGKIVIDARNKSFFRRVDLHGEKYVGSEEDVILAEGLPIDIALTIEMEAIRYVIVALLLLIPITLWSRSHWNDLQSLSKMADEFGKGQLSVRSKLKKSASIFPLAEHINRMAERIQTLLGAQRHLLHSVSHELRTPISRLEFGMELLRKAVQDPMVKTRIDAMQEDLTELNTLVSELLNMAKFDQQQAIQSSPFELAATIQNCLEGLKHELISKTIIINLADGQNILYGEQRLLTRSISNLIKNAAKYADQKILISSSANANEGIDISVEDDGPGIPESEYERIFDPFYRLDRSRDRTTGGFGLGLSIAQQAVQQHGGNIKASRSKLGGACFVIHLPK